MIKLHLLARALERHGNYYREVRTYGKNSKDRAKAVS